MREGGQQRRQAPARADADLGLEGGGEEERMVGQLDGLDAGVGRGRGDRDAGGLQRAGAFIG